MSKDNTTLAGRTDHPYQNDWQLADSTNWHTTASRDHVFNCHGTPTRRRRSGSVIPIIVIVILVVAYHLIGSVLFNADLAALAEAMGALVMAINLWVVAKVEHGTTCRTPN